VVIRAAPPRARCRLKDHQRVKLRHERRRAFVVAAVVGQFDDVGGREFTELVHRVALYVTAQQDRSAGGLDADHHGAVVGRLIGPGGIGVQP